MTTYKKLQKELEKIFKQLPQLPDSSKETLVRVWPWIALVFGVIQIVATWALIKLLNTAESILLIGNSFLGSRAGMSAFDKFTIYLGIIFLVVDAIILLLAYPELKKRSRKGWELIFLGSIINVVYSVISIFIISRGFSTFVFSLLGSAVGFYLLFQVRTKYSSDKLVENRKVRKANT